MKITAAAAALLGGALLCGTAHAGTLFDAYQAFCVKPAAQSQAVLAIADAQHFDKLPAASLEGYRKAGASVVEGRGDQKSHLVIIVEQTRETIAGHPRDVAYCTVMATLTDEKALVHAEFDRWMSGIKPSNGVYSFIDDGGTRRPFDAVPLSQVVSVLNSGKVRSAAIHDQGDLTKIVYVADAK